jgi:hypothetical protein
MVMKTLFVLLVTVALLWAGSQALIVGASIVNTSSIATSVEEVFK